MSTDTPKKDKKRRSKRKSTDLSPIIPTNNTEINGLKDKSAKKKHKKVKKKKDKKKDRKGSSDDNATSNELIEANEVESSVQPSGAIFSLLTRSNPTKGNLKDSPYQIKTIIGSAALLPTSLQSVPNKIKSLLHTLLLRYDANLGGVLLSLENDTKILPLKEPHGGIGAKGLFGGKIIDDLPFVHYRFQVHGLVFCPKVGMKVSSYYICTLTLFDTIPRVQHPVFLQYKAQRASN
jgi:hypothetical protein